MNVVNIESGSSPLILAQPHGGTEVPESIWQVLNDTGRALADTDWHINRLYDGLLDDVTVVKSNIHRYAIDANRGPDDESLYPGQNTTGLCPVTDFDGSPIYRDDEEPSPAGIEQRRLVYHQPYHQALEGEICRLKKIHGKVILYDCHSIRSHIPFLFHGRLPDFNIGTFNGASCAPEIQACIERICAAANGYDSVTNGRFKGGWTTRHYGNPQSGIHAIQMELAQHTYMSEQAPWKYDEAKAGKLRITLKLILNSLIELV